jgi:hypothetical protein
MEKDISEELAALSAKVSGLKRERWLWRIGLAVVAAGLIVTGAVAVNPVADEVRARKIVVVDGEGKTRALVDVFPYGPELILFDAQEQVRAWLTVTTSGPALVLYDAEGEERAALTAYSGRPELALYDAQGKRRAGLSVPAEDRTIVPPVERGGPQASKRMGGEVLGKAR